MLRVIHSCLCLFFFFFSSRRRHTRFDCDWSSDVCSSDLAVNCGALSEALINAELFGHESGALTGAFGNLPGRFEDAHGGTLLLDEIDDLPDRKSTRLNSSHSQISYAVFCLKKKKTRSRLVALPP